MQAGRHLTVLKVNDLGEEIYSTPALVDGGVIVRTRAHLALFRSGAREPRKDAKEPVRPMDLLTYEPATHAMIAIGNYGDSDTAPIVSIRSE